MHTASRMWDIYVFMLIWTGIRFGSDSVLVQDLFVRTRNYLLNVVYVNCLFVLRTARSIPQYQPLACHDEFTSFWVCLLDHSCRLIRRTINVVAMNHPIQVLKVVHRTFLELQLDRVWSQTDVCASNKLH